MKASQAKVQKLNHFGKKRKVGVLKLGELGSYILMIAKLE
jgi:hypothetical protein